jgi:2-oxoglutarate ferredoxin oxidoreductase subunit delta
MKENSKRRDMAEVIFETDLCKGCGLCVDACPKKIIVINREQINIKGHCPAMITDQSLCIGCASCATMCPDCVITVKR